MFIKRTAEEILQQTVDLIQKNTPITNMHAGGIARSLVEAMKGEYPRLYDFAEDVLHQGFLSRAKDEWLELIGGLFSYPRRKRAVYNAQTGTYKEELIDKETYRYEISQRTLTAANANEQAIRLACLAINGVQDLILKEYSHGTGSFSLLLITEYGFTHEEVKRDVETKIPNAKSFGVKPTILLPVEIPLELQIQLILQESADLTEKAHIIYETKSHLYNHYGNFNMEQPFIYNDLVQEIMNVNAKIIDFQILQFYLNQEPVLLMNHEVADDERIRPKRIEIL